MQKTKWEKFVEKYLFLYRDGFFELPYLSNSPILLYNSVIQNPFAKHSSVQKSISSNNAFFNGTMFYRKLENNFWIFPTHISIKQNIIAKAIYDDTIFSQFFVLSFSKFDYEFPILNGKNIKLQSICWTLYKPKTEVETYFYKNTQGKFYNIIFDKNWIFNNIINKHFPENNVIKNLFKNEVGFYTWLDIVPDAHNIAKAISQLVQRDGGTAQSTAELKRLSLELIFKFLCFINSQQTEFTNTTLSNLDYCKIARAEKTILLHLNMPFIGVKAIASIVNMSATKLKTDFKAVFGFSMLQYHKEKNMLLAKQLIINSTAKIQHIVQLTGYESASKFSASFKKRFGNLPTAFR